MELTKTRERKIDGSSLTKEDLTFESMSKNVDIIYQDLLEAGWKMTDIDNTEIFELIRILQLKNKKKANLKL